MVRLQNAERCVAYCCWVATAGLSLNGVCYEYRNITVHNVPKSKLFSRLPLMNNKSGQKIDLLQIPISQMYFGILWEANLVSDQNKDKCG